MIKYGSISYICEVFDPDGEYYASVDAKTLDDCIKEAQRYLAPEYTAHYYERREIMAVLTCST